jgi:hypothetical protein
MQRTKVWTVLVALVVALGVASPASASNPAGAALDSPQGLTYIELSVSMKVKDHQSFVSSCSGRDFLEGDGICDVTFLASPHGLSPFDAGGGDLHWTCHADGVCNVVIRADSSGSLMGDAGVKGTTLRVVAGNDGYMLYEIVTGTGGAAGQ